VDKTMGDQGRHMVSVYIQEASRKGKDAPLSQRKTDWTPDSLGKWSDTHAKDTEPGFLHLAGQEQSAKSSIAQRAEGDSPEAQSAAQRLKETPEMLIRLEDGTETKAADALREADEAIKQAKTEAAAFKAAIACALRFE
jgi:hypothetical protein